MMNRSRIQIKVLVAQSKPEFDSEKDKSPFKNHLTHELAFDFLSCAIPLFHHIYYDFFQTSLYVKSMHLLHNLIIHTNELYLIWYDYPLFTRASIIRIPLVAV